MSKKSKGRQYAKIQRHKTMLGEFLDGQKVSLPELCRLKRQSDHAKQELKAQKKAASA